MHLSSVCESHSVDNIAQTTAASTHACFMLDTSGNGTGYGQYVHYYASAQGCERRAAHLSVPLPRLSHVYVCVCVHVCACACACVWVCACGSHSLGRASPRLLGLEAPKCARHDQRCVRTYMRVRLPRCMCLCVWVYRMSHALTAASLAWIPCESAGAADYNYPTYNGLPTTPAWRLPEPPINR